MVPKINIGKIFGLDLRSLAFFRVCISFLIIADFLSRLFDLKAHYTDLGVVPRSFFMSSNVYPWYLSVHFLSGDAWFEAALFLLAITAATLLLLGYKTRFMALITWYLTISLHIRNPFIVDNGDVLIGWALFWGIFLPLGARFSIDNALAKSRTKKQSIYFSFGTLAIIAQFIFVYFFAALQKTSDPAWLSGTAVYKSLSFDMMATGLGHHLLNFPFILFLINYAVLTFEFLGPFLMLLPFPWFRIGIFLGFLLMQASFGASIKLGVFPWISITLSTIFIPAIFWDWIKLKTRGINKTKYAIKNFLKKFQKSPGALTKDRLYVKLLVFSCLIFSLILNLNSLGIIRIPEKLISTDDKLTMQQNWQMFVRLGNYDGWYVVFGQTMNGTLVNLLQKDTPFSWDRPNLISSTYKNHHWQLYMRFILRSKNPSLFYNYGRYLCDDWNSAHSQNRINEISVYYNYEKDISKGNAATLLWKDFC